VSVAQFHLWPYLMDCSLHCYGALQCAEVRQKKMNLDVGISLFTDPIRPRKLMNHLRLKTHTTERQPTVMKLGAFPDSPCRGRRPASQAPGLHG
jgi:hypothetical protein